MELKLLSKDKTRTRFLIKGIDYETANAIRRTIIEEVPVMAIEEVEFRKNDSALYDEILANRLGLIPLKTDLKGYTLKEQCSCKQAGCAKCQCMLTLTKKGPCTVYASDLKSSDPKIIPVFNQIPIVKLIGEQELEFIGTVSLGKGKDHAKYIPCLIYYTHKADIEAKPNEKCLNMYPKLFKKEGGKIVIDKKNIYEYDLWFAASESFPDLIKVTPIKDSFVFTMESWGQLTNKEILTECFNILNNKFNQFQKEFKNAVK